MIISVIGSTTICWLYFTTPTENSLPLIKVSIKIKLAPSGEILSRTLIQSSGDNKFDDSAMKAVGKISFLKEISNLNREDFEKYFREVNLVFKSR